MNDKIECLECNRELGSITSQHLKLCCGLSIQEYKEKYPNAETISEKVKLIRKQNCKNLIGKTKIVKCSKCDREMETVAVNRWDGICVKCREPETYPNEVYLKDKDLVICQICWKAFEQLGTHTKKEHDLTIPEYRKLYPQAYITNEGIRQKRRERYTGDGNPMKNPEVSAKVRDKMKGENNLYYGKKRPDHSIKMMGKNNPAWQGGISFEPYCEIWSDKEYMDYLIERDNKECKNPYCNRVTNDICRHHIDHVKKNCGPENIICICRSCNTRAESPKSKKYYDRLYKRIRKLSFNEKLMFEYGA